MAAKETVLTPATERTKQPRTGAQILVDQLGIHRVDTVYCVPGESYLAVLDALHDVQERIRLVVCRQEGGTAYMADAYGKLTGQPGICFVTRGPGATKDELGRLWSKVAGAVRPGNTAIISGAVANTSGLRPSLIPLPRLASANTRNTSRSMVP